MSKYAARTISAVFLETAKVMEPREYMVIDVNDDNITSVDSGGDEDEAWSRREELTIVQGGDKLTELRLPPWRPLL